MHGKGKCMALYDLHMVLKVHAVSSVAISKVSE